MKECWGSSLWTTFWEILLPDRSSLETFSKFSSANSRLGGRNNEIYRLAQTAPHFISGGAGIITANVDNDAGGITTYSIAGATYGYKLLWTQIPMIIALYFIQEMNSVWGRHRKGLADLIRALRSKKSLFLRC